ncbi:hypothetical protein Q5H93_09895 [Hymenobacter sp. ASUV-10]|uniref:DUF1573 domain-containing protein n=1 Tax=Hymenobacter aranciens TaxID=3063996 RepID=A0ABT9B9V6_9BACT|nr:hypothetical protein [Hymenobacter sp. ASUV-10]MDO7875041.1 hypothetical protein [Hymenobacter sp. ASUV-10]
MKRLLALLFLLFLVRLAGAAPAPPVDLLTAIGQGQVTLTAKALNGLGPETLACILTNSGPKELPVRVPPGLHFVAADAGAQDLFTFQQQLLVLAPGASRTIRLWGFCMEKHDYVPRSPTAYTCAGRAEKGLAALGDSLQKYPGLAGSYGQSFVWHLSDGEPLPTDIEVSPAQLRGATNIVAYLASVSSQVRSRVRSSATARAPRLKTFARRVPLLYHSPTAQVATLQVCNAQGQRRYDLFTNRRLTPGVLRYTFGMNETVDAASQPVYVFRLVDAQGKVLKEMRVDENTSQDEPELLHQTFAAEFNLAKPIKNVRFRVRRPDGTLVEEIGQHPYLPAGKFRYSSAFYHLYPAGTAFTIGLETAAGERVASQPVAGQ